MRSKRQNSELSRGICWSAPRAPRNLPTSATSPPAWATVEAELSPALSARILREATAIVREPAAPSATDLRATVLRVAPDWSLPNGRRDPDIAAVIAFDAARESGRHRRRMRGAQMAAAGAAAAAVISITVAVRDRPVSTLSALADRTGRESGARRVKLRRPTGEAVADVVVGESGRGYVRADRLAALPAGQTYQLWATTNGRPVSAGVLGRRPGIAAFTVNAPLLGVSLSIEPETGSTQPSSEPFASAQF